MLRTPDPHDMAWRNPSAYACRIIVLRGNRCETAVPVRIRIQNYIETVQVMPDIWVQVKIRIQNYRKECNVMIRHMGAVRIRIQNYCFDGKLGTRGTHATWAARIRIISADIGCHEFAQNQGEPKALAQNHNAGPCRRGRVRTQGVAGFMGRDAR